MINCGEPYLLFVNGPLAQGQRTALDKLRRWVK